MFAGTFFVSRLVLLYFLNCRSVCGSFHCAYTMKLYFAEHFGRTLALAATRHQTSNQCTVSTKAEVLSRNVLRNKVASCLCSEVCYIATILKLHG